MSKQSDTPSPFEKLCFLREEERHEVSWIGHRMGWLLLAQSFLMTAAIMAQSNDYPWWTGTASTFILGCLGTWLAIRGGLAINAAQDVIHAWLKRERQVVQACPELMRLRLSRPLHQPVTNSEDHLHDVAIKFHTRSMLPMVFTWLLLYAVAIRVGLGRLRGVKSSDSELCKLFGTDNLKETFLYITVFAGCLAIAVFGYLFASGYCVMRNTARELAEENADQTA
jgi:hypothetical protein